MNEQPPRYISLAAIILGIIFVILCMMLVRQYEHVRQAESRLSYSMIFERLRHRGPLLPADASLIQPWMTFRYVAFMFRLPPDYLRTTLSITDTAYPNITLGHYAKIHALDSTAFVESVSRTVAGYINTHQ